MSLARALSASFVLISVSACGNKSTVAPSTEKVVACLTTIPPSVTVKSGTASIGNDHAYREEGPKRSINISAFDIDATEVTNGAFREFVTATGYVTDAEKKQAGFNVPGGAVFRTPDAENTSWWQFVEGASWKHPEGPESSIIGRDYDPVVQISLKDAKAYAAWSGRRLPTQDEWEYAANAGSDDTYVWGSERAPNGEEQANTWQGAFPLENLADDGYLRRAPVGCYTPNAFELYDMIGNVWEWTDTPFSRQSGTIQYVIKGGSFLCAPNYCRRYRASALQPQDADFTTNHIGFRTVGDLSN